MKLAGQEAERKTIGRDLWTYPKRESAGVKADEADVGVMWQIVIGCGNPLKGVA